MKNENRAVVDALLRSDLAAFTQRCFQTVAPGATYLSNWHIEAIAHQLERCRQGQIRRLIVTLPPRSLKSITASVAFPAFALGHDPKLPIVCASYSQDLAAKHARDFRAVLQSEWYQRIFPMARIDPQKNTEPEIQLTEKGCRLSTSLGGTLTGRGGTLILIDDPMKPAERMSEARRAAVSEWYDLAVWTSSGEIYARDVVEQFAECDLTPVRGANGITKEGIGVLQAPGLGAHADVDFLAIDDALARVAVFVDNTIG